MTHRIAVTSKIEDARARSILRFLKSRLPETALTNVAFAAAYSTDAELSEKELERTAEVLTNSVIEAYSIDTIPQPADFSYVLEIGYLPGVTDNPGATAKETIEDALGRKLPENAGVYSSRIFFLFGELTEDDVKVIAAQLHNPLIERARAAFRDEVARGFAIEIPRVELETEEPTLEASLEVDDAELERIGKEGIQDKSGARRGPLALSLPQLKAIREHFRTLSRNPTDVELESLAQTWSEHCKHTIFADPLDDIEEGIYRRYIKGATERIRKEKGAKDFCVSVFKDNSGAIAFDDEYLVTHKVETHNAPSALDPFGGAVTAIVGVNRDCLGFGLGAKPIANVYGFCVADPTDETPYYRDQERSQRLLSNRRILEGVVQGINAGGNESGIPTPLGFVAVDPSFRAKPLVFGGTIGLIPREKGGRKLYEKKAQPGDYIVMVGGRVGLDGIHGATFSSESLSKGSPATAVQIGDPITQKKLSDALIREARDAQLYNSITDNGAGGLSGSVGEMSREAGGCEVELAHVPRKYAGLSPWQVWISESQERMTLAVPKEKWSSLQAVFERHGVEAAVIGEFTDSGRCIVKHEGKTVMDLALEFLHDGRPIEKRRTKEPARAERDDSFDDIDPAEALRELLRRPSIGSIAFISRQYDFEVQGTSVTKPLHGRGGVNAEAAVLRPRYDSDRGIVLAHGVYPWYSEHDTYAMAAASIDAAIRNAICVGADLDHLAILDNFCWSSSNTPERLWDLRRAAEACYDTAIAYGTPFISGKDSMHNDFRGFDEKGDPVALAALPTLLVSAIGVIENVSRALTIDFKNEGDSVYVLGETNAELASSELALWKGRSASRVPHVDPQKNARVYRALSQANEAGVVASAIGIGRGGLGVALARAAVAGQLGAEVDVSGIAGDARRAAEKLFSESSGRALISVKHEQEAAFEKHAAGCSFSKIGTVGGEDVAIAGSASVSVDTLSEDYRSFFRDW